ncbi:MAG: potassium-transporting ATPase subunit KdpC [Planctomycetota bacterium]|nr:potassium-transporting ATPase subunit KdpC [Planctomycetota bacterium]
MHLIRPAVVSLVLLTLITGVAYPLVVTALAQVVYDGQANGSLLIANGKAVGSELIGQPFTDPRYFRSRPSATSPFAYNSEASSGSNLAPTNPALTKAVQERIDALKTADPTNTQPIPIDLMTASGSGLDPHISPAAAEYQVARVARARKLDESMVRRLVAQYADGRDWGLLGEPRVNVLKLNFALDHPEWSKGQRLPPSTRFLRQRAFMPER